MVRRSGDPDPAWDLGMARKMAVRLSSRSDTRRLAHTGFGGGSRNDRHDRHERFRRYFLAIFQRFPWSILQRQLLALRIFRYPDPFISIEILGRRGSIYRTDRSVGRINPGIWVETFP